LSFFFFPLWCRSIKLASESPLSACANAESSFSLFSAQVIASFFFFFAVREHAPSLRTGRRTHASLSCCLREMSRVGVSLFFLIEAVLTTRLPLLFFPSNHVRAPSPFFFLSPWASKRARTLSSLHFLLIAQIVLFPPPRRKEQAIHFSARDPFSPFKPQRGVIPPFPSLSYNLKHSPWRQAFLSQT